MKVHILCKVDYQKEEVNPVSVFTNYKEAKKALLSIKDNVLKECPLWNKHGIKEPAYWKETETSIEAMDYSDYRSDVYHVKAFIVTRTIDDNE